MHLPEEHEVGCTHLRAGEAAAALGVGVQTLHYYEREALIPEPPRSEAGYRLYSPALMERLQFIRRAQALGLSLAEIRETLQLIEVGESPCGRVQTALAAKLEEVDHRLTNLLAFREQLRDLIASTPRPQRGPDVGEMCPIVQQSTPITGAELASKPLARMRRPK